MLFCNNKHRFSIKKYIITLKRKLYQLFGAKQKENQQQINNLMEELDNNFQFISHEEKTILHNVLNLDRKKVSDIMIQRTEICALAHNISLKDLRTLLSTKMHTRFPIYKDSLDNIIGFVNIKDLLPILNEKEFKLEKLVRKLMTIPPSKRLIDLLVRMRANRVHMALVVDEYGGTDGLITIEDVVEEIIGDIKDEHDINKDPEIIKIDDNLYKSSARIDIEALENILELNLVNQEDHFETLGGLILSLAGYVPKNGEIIKHPIGVEFEIIDSDPRKINHVLIKLINDLNDIVLNEE